MINYKSMFSGGLVVLLILVFASYGYAALADKYPGDKGIENDPDVLFTENFETGTIAEICKRWDAFKNKDGKVMALSDDIPAGSAGTRSLQMTGTLGENSGGDLYTRFPSQDKAFLRFYTKFAADHAYEHHFVGFGGHNPPSRWPDPKAGTRPNGDDRIHVMIDPIGVRGKYPPPGIWSLYTYWPEMKISADGNYWGNCLNPAEPAIVARDKWICVELMVKMNSAPDKADGELTLWIDGEQVAHFIKGVKRGLWSGMGFDLVKEGGQPFEGLRLRTDNALKINYLWLEHYVDEGAQRQNRVKNPNKVNRVWFDNIVVARKYIGPIAPKSKTIKVAAIQAKNRTISYKVSTPQQALRKVQSNLDELVELADKAGRMGCKIIAFPEDTLGTFEWEAGHWKNVGELLVPAEKAMLSRLGQMAAKYKMYIICCNDCAQGDKVYNTSILIGADGREIGRYRKVNLPLHERARTAGDEFPVFDIPGIGTLGMCICYDITMPETTRALALAGADIVFHLTMGGASTAGRDASLACFKARAAENFIYLVVAFRSGGSMIISPKAKILAEGGRQSDAIVTADIDISSGRQTGDAHGGITTDYRARMFRERNTKAYGILLDENPPILNKLKHVYVPSDAEAAALSAEITTTAADAFYEAERWLSEGKTDKAKERFEKLAERFGTTWIGRAARRQLKKIAEQ
ncbi:MAG: carbon-nitrogen hydrolase family protein [Planctomycetota bacterium]|jgi:predicted amidohydrolase